MRPIWYNYPTATDTFGMENEFMLGDFLLIVPVTESGQSNVEAFFPGGDRWFRLDHHESVFHSGTQLVSAGLEEPIPTFIKENSAFVIRDRIRRSSTLMENDPFTLVVSQTVSGLASGEVYFDDGITHDYEKGEFSLKQVKLENNILTYR